LVGCGLILNLGKDSDLKDRYDYRSFDENFTFFYSVTNEKDYNMIEMAIKNKSGRLIHDLSITVWSSDKVKYNHYFYLGKAKSLSSKYLSFKIPYDIKRLTISYQFAPISEDKFLRREINYGGEEYRIEKDIVINIP